MGVTFYEPAPTPGDEVAREQAVLTSGALAARDDPGLQMLLDDCRRTLATGMAAVTILYQEWQYLIATSGVTSRTYSRRTSLCGHAIMTPHQLFCIADSLADPRFAANPLRIDGQQVRFYAGAPLVDGGMPLGALCVLDRAPRDDFGAYERMRLRQFGDAAMARLAALRPR
ncbi:GAF domain-containing protein [Sphingomonas endophytica]|uniref:GAF domain-containing protein n=1 Tax=Sphingomonas endophytica TaxID=869719 RepID=A0A147I4G3_9SPHN|nr:GAF domain-containing protein [Sphingomonas endophytica]KTT73069.1 hypothetical protein NS334_07895 [Sphingomonas endophytica]